VDKGLTTGKAATRLGTTKPTVRSLIVTGVLRATKQPQGSRFQWMIDEQSIEGFLVEHGRYDDRSRRAGSNVKSVNRRLSTLEQEVSRLSSGNSRFARPPDLESTARQLDDARARIVDLEEALVRSRVAAELQREADDARSAVVEHLLAAVAAAERADEFRRRAHAELDEALQGFSREGHAGDVR
jgi:excisionase family DNA binding protein